MPGKYTWGEAARLARLEFKDARKVIAAGDADAAGSGRRQNRIHDKAEARWERNANAALDLLRSADAELARAEASLRAARGTDKAAARRTRNDARDKQRRADRAARKYT
jgi:hypothetical protein